MIKDSETAWGEEPLQKISSLICFEQKKDEARLLYLDITFHISFPVQLLKEGVSYSRRSEADGERQRTNVWPLSSGRRLATLSIIFMGLSLSPAEEQSGAEQSGEMAVMGGGVCSRSGRTLPAVTHPDYYGGRQPLHKVSRSQGPWWNNDENKWGPRQCKVQSAFQQLNTVVL